MLQGFLQVLWRGLMPASYLYGGMSFGGHTHTPKKEGGTFSGARGIRGLLGILKVQGSLSAKHFPKFMLLYILKPIKDILEVLQGCFAERPGREIPNQAFAQGLIGSFFFFFVCVCVFVMVLG